MQTVLTVTFVDDLLRLYKGRVGGGGYNRLLYYYDKPVLRKIALYEEKKTSNKGRQTSWSEVHPTARQ